MQDKSEIIEKPQNVDHEYTVENLVKNSENILDLISTPIEIFEFEILKAKILYETSQEIQIVWPKILNKTVENKKRKDVTNFLDFVELLSNAILDVGKSGLATYFVYTEQALVSAVTASEVYFRNKLFDTVQNDKRILKSFSDTPIKIERIIETDLDILTILADCVVSDKNFQNISEVQKYYKKAFGSDFELCSEPELKELNKIFSIRHVIVHKAGIFDRKFNSETGLNYEIGKRHIFRRNEIIQMINFLEDIITNLNLKIDNKLKTRIA